MDQFSDVHGPHLEVLRLCGVVGGGLGPRVQRRNLGEIHLSVFVFMQRVEEVDS